MASLILAIPISTGIIMGKYYSDFLDREFKEINSINSSTLSAEAKDAKIREKIIEIQLVNKYLPPYVEWNYFRP